MLVRANTVGFYGGSRRRAGAVFEMDDKAIKKDKDGKIVKPRWVSDAAVPEKKAQQKKGARGDVKPPETQAAVKSKVDGNDGQTGAEGLA
jgi:hypothetical protein